MTLREKIDKDFKEAFKAKEEARLGTMRMLLAAIKNKEVEKRTKLAKTEPPEKLEELSRLNDDEIIGVISTEVKKRKESVEQYSQGGRAELAEKEQREMEILSVYLPQQLSESEIVKLVDEAIGQTKVSDIKDIGRVMAALMPKVKGKADGSLVSRIVKERLEK